MSEQDHTQQSSPGREEAQGDARSPRDERPDRGGRGGGGGGSGSERRRGTGRGGSRRHGGQPSTQQQGQQYRRTESSLNMEELRELTELFTAHGLTDFEFENAEIRVRLSRSLAPQTITTTAGAAHAVAPSAATHEAPSNSSAAASAPGGSGSAGASGEAATAEEKAEDLHIITSPIVGTFYRAPSPNVEPFVKVGSHVEPDSVVCIIEAMKLMNEIPAETAGTVEKIYVENGQPVEYGQPLFGVKK